MTRRQTGIIMDILSTAYPQFYAGADAPDPAKTMALWAEMFAEDDVVMVAAAVKALIATDERGYPPHIGAVKAKLRQITVKPGLTAQEAWNLVAKAIRNSGYESREEYAKLPPELQRLVGSPDQLKDWSQMDSETVHSVVASNFQRSYAAEQKRQESDRALPSDVKALVGSMAERMALQE